jgi:hypothetical protein
MEIQNTDDNKEKLEKLTKDAIFKYYADILDNVKLDLNPRWGDF